MPSTLDQPTAAPSYLTPAPDPDPVRHDLEGDPASPSSGSQAHRAGWPVVILASGGTGAAAALLAGPFVGPLGALAAGVAGVIVGIVIQKSQKSKVEVK